MKTKVKQVRIAELSNLRMASGNARRIKAVILDGTVRRWVGIGWVDEGEPSSRQRRTLPVVVS